MLVELPPEGGGDGPVEMRFRYQLSCSSRPPEPTIHEADDLKHLARHRALLLALDALVLRELPPQSLNSSASSRSMTSRPVTLRTARLSPRLLSSTIVVSAAPVMPLVPDTVLNGSGSPLLTQLAMSRASQLLPTFGDPTSRVTPTPTRSSTTHPGELSGVLTSSSAVLSQAPSLSLPSVLIDPVTGEEIDDPYTGRRMEGVEREGARRAVCDLDLLNGEL